MADHTEIPPSSMQTSALPTVHADLLLEEASLREPEPASVARPATSEKPPEKAFA